MMPKSVFFTICIILGAAVAEPLRKVSNNVESSEPSSSLDVAARTDISSIIEIICSLIGYKISAVSIAIGVIQWAVSNIHVVLLGAASVLGFCKFTGKCNLDYESFIPLSEIESYATPENIQVAESLFRTAVEKYNEKRSFDL